jgi:hypothetical protein
MRLIMELQERVLRAQELAERAERMLAHAEDAIRRLDIRD